MRYAITIEVTPIDDTRPGDLSPKELARAVLRSDLEPIPGYGVGRGAHKLRFVDVEIVGLSDLEASVASAAPEDPATGRAVLGGAARRPERASELVE